MSSEHVHFNGLTPAQAEALAKISEECAEVIQAISKILLHGFDSAYPEGAPCNRDKLEHELGDLVAATSVAADLSIVSGKAVEDRCEAKLHRMSKWLHHITIDTNGNAHAL